MTRPWRLSGSSLDLVFRDRDLSDRIGFWYAKMSAHEAAENFFAQVKHIEDKLPQDETRILCVILDGENPWEHYHDGGRQLLALLYRGLRGRCLGLSQALSQPSLQRGALSSLHSGSWIEASFRIWLGGAADNRAWSVLGQTRAALEAAIQGGLSGEVLSLARRHMAIAEGSDWFWWFGDDFASEEKLFFDALFRGRLLAVYRALQKSPPEALLRPIEELSGGLSHREPTKPISPALDGRLSSLPSWEGAGELIVDRGRSSMFSGSEPFERLFFGGMARRFFLRMQPSQSSTAGARWFEGLSVLLCFDTAEGRQEILFAPGVPSPHLAIFDEVLEVAVEVSSMRDRSFYVVVQRGSHVVARYPSIGDIFLQG